MNIPFIDLSSQYQRIRSEIDTAIHQVLNHGQYIMGPEITELENELARFIGAKYALACSSGTDALLLPLLTKKLTQEDAIFTTPFTFFASAEAITLAGGTPVFVDIDPSTYTMCPNALERAINQTQKEGKLRPTGVIPVDLFGIAADYDSIMQIAHLHNLFVLEDAAQSYGAKYKSKKAGNLAHVGATSFYPAKPLGCYGDGGAVFTNDEQLYEEMTSLRVHGQAQSGDKYDNVRVGINGRMDTIQAAILLAKLKIYPDEIVRRNEVASAYNSKLDEEFITKPIVPSEQESVWAQYSIKTANRDHLKAELQSRGIPTAIFYPIPIHLSTAYRHLGYKLGDFPESETLSKCIISLPMHPYLDSKTIEEICSIVNLASKTSLPSK